MMQNGEKDIASTTKGRREQFYCRPDGPKFMRVFQRTSVLLSCRLWKNTLECFRRLKCECMKSESVCNAEENSREMYRAARVSLCTSPTLFFRDSVPFSGGDRSFPFQFCFTLSHFVNVSFYDAWNESTTSLKSDCVCKDALYYESNCKSDWIAIQSIPQE